MSLTTLGSVASAHGTITVSLANPEPDPIVSHVDGGGVVTYRIHLDNPDTTFYLAEIDLEVSTSSLDTFSVRVFDYWGESVEEGSIGGGRPRFTSGLFSAIDLADETGSQFWVEIDNSGNLLSQDFTLEITAHASTRSALDVDPTTWSPTITCGDSTSRYVSVSTGGSPVKDVTLSMLSGPEWLTLSITNLGEIASGSSVSFKFTASPPSLAGGDFNYALRVSTAAGTPSPKDVTGTIHVECPSEYDIQPDSKQDDVAGDNDGMVFDGTISSPLDDFEVQADGHDVIYNPAKGYEFIGWETGGSVSLSDAYSQTTTVTVDDDGTLEAIYNVTPPPTYQVHLESKQSDSIAGDNGSITFDGTDYSLPDDFEGQADDYTATYNPANGCEFVSWETGGGVNVSDAYSRTTTVTLSNDGTLGAVYKAIPPPTYQVHLISTQDNGVVGDSGSITFDGTGYSLPDDFESQADDYTVVYNAARGYEFVRWEAGGGVSVSDAYSRTATVTVSDEGTLEAVYKAAPQPVYQIYLDSRQDNNVTGNEGSITFDGSEHSLPDDFQGQADDYIATYVVADGYGFASWRTSGGVSVSNAYSQTTAVTVSDDGTLRATYVAVDSDAVDVGYAIVVAGRNSSGTLLQEHLGTAAFAYSTLLGRGFTDERIYLMAPDEDLDADGDSLSDVDAISTSSNLRDAIVNIDQWAVDVSASTSLYIFIVDHGSYDSFSINSEDFVQDSDLGTWLDQMSTDIGISDIVVVYQACYSGSFVDELSGANRIIITSVSADELSYAILGMGSIFSWYFWTSISQQNSIGTAFEEAVTNTVNDLGETQTPLLDDNGDGVGHSAPLVDAGDGSRAANKYIGFQAEG